MSLRLIVHSALKTSLLKKRMNRIIQACWAKEAINVYLDEDLTELIKQEKGEQTLSLFVEGYNLGLDTKKQLGKDHDD